MIKCNLKYYMETKNINFSQLSSIVGISRQALTALANNESSGIQFSTLESLLSFFNITFNDLFIQSDMEYAAYINFENQDDLNNCYICVQRNKDEEVIPYSIKFLSNQKNELEIIEFIISDTNAIINTKFFDPFFSLLLSVSNDRFNEFGASLLSDILKNISDLYTIPSSIRVSIDLDFDFRIAYVELDEKNNPVIDERNELNPKDDFLSLPLFDLN